MRISENRRTFALGKMQCSWQIGRIWNW